MSQEQRLIAPLCGNWVEIAELQEDETNAFIGVGAVLVMIIALGVVVWQFKLSPVCWGVPGVLFLVGIAFLVIGFRKRNKRLMLTEPASIPDGVHE